MRFLKSIVRKVIFGYKTSSDAYAKYLRKKGAIIGEHFCLFCPNLCEIDVQNPHLLRIGDDFRATGPLTILTHDYSWSVLHRKYGVIVGNQKSVVIHNNVFCGWGCTILCGVEIGENVIIGANSLVTKNCEANSVYGGVPAKKIMDLDEYLNKRLTSQIEEMDCFIKNYISRFKRFPDKEKLNEYFYLFSDPKEAANTFRSRLELQGDIELSLKYLANYERPFNCYEDLKKKYETE